ncbi:MAG: hypothetical protein C0483_19125 [Pirellula sp.]|nr:hypothetical protein [Pirellula sp.]
MPLAPSHGFGDAPTTLDVDQATLRTLQELIGQWKGVGQVRRGSAKGSWIEVGDWAWDFTDGKSAVAFASPASKHFRAGRITAGDRREILLLKARTADGKELAYEGGRRDDGAWEFLAVDKTPTAQTPSRVVLRLTAEGKRLIMLLERRLGTADDAFATLAEIGYTRAGSNFGQGSGGPKCIVTDGAGTIAVSHAGKTYYVCCSGCKELFDSEPEKVIADYQARIAAPHK